MIFFKPLQQQNMYYLLCSYMCSYMDLTKSKTAAIRNDSCEIAMHVHVAIAILIITHFL